MTRRRVVLTGLGIVCPIGNTVQQAWDSALAGQPGITRITRFDASRLASQIAGEVKGFDVAPYLSAKDARRMDQFIHYGMAAGLQAWRDCGLQSGADNAERIGINFGSGIGGLPLIETMHDELKKSGPRRISPFFIPGSIINMIAGLLSIQIGAKGPNLAMVTACTTSTHCIGEAAKSIRYGEVDVMVAGGAEAVVTELAVGGFASARALSTRNHDPATASRPWDKERDGFVLGEGAGAVVLEEYEHAKARGANIYCELVGYGVSADAFHITAPPEDGDGGFRAMRNALKDANLESSAIDYINAHGTSTPLGDVAETKAVKRLLGGHAAKVAVNSTKSMTRWSWRAFERPGPFAARARSVPRPGGNDHGAACDGGRLRFTRIALDCGCHAGELPDGSWPGGGVEPRAAEVAGIGARPGSFRIGSHSRACERRKNRLPAGRAPLRQPVHGDAAAASPDAAHGPDHRRHAGERRLPAAAHLGAVGQAARRGERATAGLSGGRRSLRTISKCVCLWHIGVANGVGSPCRAAPGGRGPMSDRDIDRQLVARAQRGDKQAFSLLVEKYQRKLARLLSRFIRDPAEVEDVTQEAFIKAYRALPAFRGDSAFYTWLYRIGINTAKNYLMAIGRRAPTSTEVEAEEAEGFDEGEQLRDINTPESVLLSKEIAETVNATIEKLPEELRKAIQMREIEGMSYEDIAQAMDCPIGTVRSRIFRAREAIAEQLRPLLGTHKNKRW